MRETITVEELHQRFTGQGVGDRNHLAFKCPVCGTVQSMASLLAAGVPDAKLENYIGFSCEGRFTGAGEWPGEKDKSAKAEKRRQVRGCNWTLGGLFQIHRLTVKLPDGAEQPSFEVATPEEAQTLRALMLAATPAAAE